MSYHNGNDSIDLVAVGGITLDYIFKVDSLPNINLASRVLDYGVYYGGRAPNVAVILAKLGYKTGVISVAGKDFEELQYMSYLKNLHIDTSGLVVNSKENTTRVYIFGDDIGNNFTFVALGSENIPKFFFQEYKDNWSNILQITKVVHLSSGNPNLSKKILEIIKEVNPQAFISFDIGNDIFFHSKEYLKNIVSMSNFILLNEYEWNYVSKIFYFSEPSEISTLGVEKIVVIIRKNKNVELYEKGEKHYFAYPINRCMRDATGTSDAFVSGFLAGYLKGLPREKCIAIGQNLIEYIGSAMGAQTNVPSWTDLEKIQGLGR